MLKAEDIEAGAVLDALIHRRVFDRTDEVVPAYSTDPDASAWLQREFDLKLMPVFGMGVLRDPRGETEDPPAGFLAYREAVPGAENGPMAGAELITRAETRELAVARAVLVLKGIVTETHKMVPA